MIEVSKGLFVGSQADYENGDFDDGWFIVLAAKNPWHRAAVGYTGRGAPRDDPEYLMARRPGRLILNLVDAPDERYIPQAILQAAVEAIGAELALGENVLVCCNQGESRAPTLAFLAMYAADMLPHEFGLAEAAFKLLYPPWDPGAGMSVAARRYIDDKEQAPE